MSEGREWKEEQYKIAVSVRQLEIENFSKRSLFFWGFIVASFVGYAQVKHGFVKSILAHFGFLASFAWYLVNRGSKYWQEVWEEKVNILEGELGKLFLVVPKIPTLNLFGPAKYSVTKVTTLLSLIVTAAWIGPIVQTYEQACQSNNAKCFDMILSVVTGFLVIFFLAFCRTSPPKAEVKESSK